MSTNFTGYSSRNDLLEALHAAIEKAKKSLQTDFISWELIRTWGEAGGFLLTTDLFVEISASAPAESNLTNSAYFEMKDASEAKHPFVVKLVEPGLIDHARRILSGQETRRVHLQGAIRKERVSYNPNWSFHLDPSTVDFFEVAVEVCDATMQFVEDNLDEIGGSTLPGNHWCPWSSELCQEIKLDKLATQ